MRRVYLDNNATTRIRPEVAEAMKRFIYEEFGNPSSIHWAGNAPKSALEKAREDVASLINARPSEIVFTSCGTEANNLAIKGIAYSHREKGNHIITSQVEHHAVLEPCRFLEKEGFRVTYLPVDRDGMWSPDDVKAAITDETILITLMMVNNEIGNIYPVEEVSKIAKERGIVFHTDAIQACGKIPVDVERICCDLLSISGHKMYAPKGVGALYIRKGVSLTPLLHGGHQERNRRCGTENIVGIVGFGRACELIKDEIDSQGKRLKELRDYLERELLERIDEIEVNGHREKRIPSTLNISLKYIDGEGVLLNLDMEGIAVSSGSACSSGSLDPSHVILAMGKGHEVAHGSIRFSLGRENTKDDIDYLLEILPPIVQRLREMSPLYLKKRSS